MFDFLLGTHEFLGNHSFPEFIVGYLFGAALIIGAPTVFLLLAFVSALMKTNGKMGGYREYETYGESSLNDAPPFLLPVLTAPGFKLFTRKVLVAPNSSASTCI